MKPSLRQRSARITVPATILLFILMAGCTDILDGWFNNSLLPEQGQLTVAGLAEDVNVRRNEFGIPFISAKNPDDLVFAQGFVSAADRLTQMTGFRLAAQGRLSEMVGPVAFETDLFLRSMNLNTAAAMIYDSASEELRHYFQVYSDGVNAYLKKYRYRLPETLAGYIPEQWQPQDCAAVFVLTTFGLAMNLEEEIDILNLVRVLGHRKAAWLFPVYPDEGMAFKDFKKLDGLDFSGTAEDLQKLFAVFNRADRFGLFSTAASNNWAVSGGLTKSGKPLLANDTHLPLSLPSTWHIMHLKCPEMEAAGICLAGMPGIVAGYNGHIAWGMTMVMADNQDVFLEKLKKEADGLYYLYLDKWLKTSTRSETFKIRGAEPVTRTIHETRHGVLLNNVLTEQARTGPVPRPIEPLPFGIAAKWAAFDKDRSLDAFFNLMKATSVNEAMPLARQIRAIALNLVMADENDIAWQVTGRYPLRKKGRGLCPSPGWTGEYDWQGYLDPEKHPFDVNPERGYIATANHRITSEESPLVLSSSWYYPDRAARAYQMIELAGKYTFEDAKNMQLDVKAPFMSYIRELLLIDPAVRQAFDNLKDKGKRALAGKGLYALSNFDGQMTVDSPGAAICSAFLYCLPKNLFADELGGTGTLAWQSLLDTFPNTYSALHDHLFPRSRSSPFWDDVNTPERETRATVLTETMVDAVLLLEARCGQDPAGWRWGDLHTYHWQTEASRLAPYLDPWQRKIIDRLSAYFDRGPYPAPGDHNTLNTAAYHPGRSFDVWLIPAMRMIVDFGRDEPLYLVNSSGQSDNPGSPHYDDGITAWRNGEYMALPFDEKAAAQAFTRSLILKAE